jgi:hypothetical protein
VCFQAPLTNQNDEHNIPQQQEESVCPSFITVLTRNEFLWHCTLNFTRKFSAYRNNFEPFNFVAMYTLLKKRFTLEQYFFVSGGKQGLKSLRDMKDYFKSLRLCL